jgi:hypothetical protein
VAAGDDPQVWAQAAFDGSRWEKMRLGVWDTPSRPNVKQAFMRKSFAVKKEWGAGDVLLWLQPWLQGGGTINNQFIRVWFDGKPVRDWSQRTVAGDDFGTRLAPGSAHVIAFEMKGESTLHGLPGDCWLSYFPAPEKSLDLKGAWTVTPDFLQDAGTVQLPGAYQNACGMRRRILVPDDAQGKEIVLSINSGKGSILGAIVNGRWERRHHHRLGNQWNLNITPWIRPGQENEIELVASTEKPDSGDLVSVRLDFYPKN